MLTRIEIDGFKTFEKFALDVSPFMVILGPNASGKSNLFDAIRLLSNLASTDLRTAVRGLRGEPHELFRRSADGEPGNRMSLAVEVLLDPRVRDPWGATVEISYSRVRYEVEIERRQDPRGIDRLVVSREKASPIPLQEDQWRPWGGSISRAFKIAFVKYGRRTPFLTTEETESGASFRINQDGRAGRTRSAEAAEATVLSSITSAEFPHLYALREELRSWRFLHLDPAAIRRPSSTTAPEDLEPDGSNLPTVLARIQAETKTEDQPRGVLADIAADMTALIPGVVELSVEEDVARREYRIDVGMGGGPPFSSRVVSDGTLRVLALLTLLHDPNNRGLICFEEPENGVHPVRLKAMIKRLKELVTDPLSKDVDKEEPLSQMLLNSHSPVVLSSLRDGLGVWFADSVSAVDPVARALSPKTRIRPVRARTQGALMPNGQGDYVSSFEVEKYLSTAEQEAA